MASIDMYRKKAARVKKRKASLEKKLNRENKKIVKLNSQISKLARQMERSSSSSSVSSKLKRIESKQKKLVRRQKKATDLESKIAKKSDKLAKALKNLQKAEDRERKRRKSEERKRRRKELRHERSMRREHEKRLRLQEKLGSMEDLPEIIKVLFFAANPTDQNQLQLNEEIREIRKKIRASEYREAVELTSRWATRSSDLLQALNEEEPHIVHFSGHGFTDGVVFMGPDGEAKPVSKSAIVQLMNTAAENIRLVLFNTCLSSGQAEAVTDHVEAAIGMEAEIGDDAARVFAGQFYSSIGFGKSVQSAFDQALTSLSLEQMKDKDIPALYSREGVEPDELILVKPAEQ